LKILHVKSCRARISRVVVLACALCIVCFSGCRRREQARQSGPAPLKGQPVIRVLLLGGVSECLFSCDSPLTLSAADMPLRPASQDAAAGVNLPIAHFDVFEEPVLIKVLAGRISFAGWSCSTGRLQVMPDPNGIFNLNGRSYRGRLHIVVAADGNSFDVVNVIETEAYLAGVIGAEMPDYWEPQALEAQTIAARTYCLYIKKHFGGSRHWDVRSTAANQTYKGVSAESQATRQAIGKTAGEVLVCRQSDGSEDIFPAYYASTCAGHTENSKNVFGDIFGPLTGVPCNYCSQIAKSELLNWASVYIDKAELYARLVKRYPQLAKLDGIEEISAVSPSRYDGLTRLTWIKLEGANGASDTLRAEDFRLAVDPTGFRMKSAAFAIQNAGSNWAFVAGKGYGHGVGLCQCGAQGLARKRKTAAQILDYYYPGAKIKKIY